MKLNHCVCVTPVLELNGVEGQRGSSIVKEEILKDRSSNHEALGKSLFYCVTEKVNHRKKCAGGCPGYVIFYFLICIRMRVPLILLHCFPLS